MTRLSWSASMSAIAKASQAALTDISEQAGEYLGKANVVEKK